MKFPVVLLAGGEGRRIGGGKPLRRLGGERLIDRAVKQARRWSDEIRIAVRQGSELEDCGAAPIYDDTELQGPLGGLAAALALARGLGAESVLVIPCDTPFLPDDLAERLSHGIGPAGVALAASGGQVHPSCGLWRVAALGALPAYAATGRRSLLGFAERVSYSEITWSCNPFDPFLNINNEADLACAEALLRSR